MHILSSLRSKCLESSFCTKVAARAKNVQSSFNKLARPERLAFPLAMQAFASCYPWLLDWLLPKNPFKQYPLNGK